jgi:hypothetical protein
LFLKNFPSCFDRLSPKSRFVPSLKLILNCLIHPPLVHFVLCQKLDGLIYLNGCFCLNHLFNMFLPRSNCQSIF